MVSLLGAVIIYTGCVRPRLGYYRHGEYNIYICDNTYIRGEYSKEYIIAHELGHLFLTMYLKKDINQESFANTFAKAYISNSGLLYNYIKQFLSLNIK